MKYVNIFSYYFIFILTKKPPTKKIVEGLYEKVLRFFYKLLSFFFLQGLP